MSIENTADYYAGISLAKYGDTAKAIAAELSDITRSHWSPVHKYETGFYLRREDGMAISLHSTFGGPGKWHASLSYQECVPDLMNYMPSLYAQGQTGRTSVNISQSKTSKQIAAELDRRLVAVVEPAFCEALSTHNETVANVEGSRAKLETLAGIIGAGDKVPEIDRTKYRNYNARVEAYKGAHGLKCRAELYVWDHGKEIEIKLSSVPADIAEQVMRLIAGEGK